MGIGLPVRFEKFPTCTLIDLHTKGYVEGMNAYGMSILLCSKVRYAREHLPKVSHSRSTLALERHIAFRISNLTF